jgi:hypothetical protein
MSTYLTLGNKTKNECGATSTYRAGSNPLDPNSNSDSLQEMCLTFRAGSKRIPVEDRGEVASVMM